MVQSWTYQVHINQTMTRIIATAKDPSTRVRFPTDLLRYLGHIAKINGRSLNSEIIARLRESQTGDAQLKKVG